MNSNLFDFFIYSGNHYGTPKPPSSPPEHLGGRGAGGSAAASGVGGPSAGTSVLPGAHPSSEGKRRRNRSNVEAMAANTTHTGPPPDPPGPYHPPQGPYPPPGSNYGGPPIVSKGSLIWS